MLQHQITPRLDRSGSSRPDKQALYLQVQSNALAALEAIDKDMADKILAQGCITGDRINGLVDGESGKW